MKIPIIFIYFFIFYFLCILYLWTRKIHINFRKGIVCKLGKDWNQRVQRGIQLPSKEGHLKQIAGMLMETDLTKVHSVYTGAHYNPCTALNLCNSSNNKYYGNIVIKIANELSL